MSKTEERALKAYPVVMTTLIPADEEHPVIEQDCNKFKREAYIEGYHQAEKDLALTWKDVELLININEDINNEEALTQVRSNKEHYEEVLKRFNDMFFH